jgi:hypothetical protein
LFQCIEQLKYEISLLSERLDKLENPDISKIRKEKIEKLFGDE